MEFIGSLDVEASEVLSIFDGIFRFLKALRRQKVHFLVKTNKISKDVLK